MGIITHFLNNWKYSNAPEGERPLEKVIGLTKFGMGGSIMMGAYDCILLSQTPTFWTTVNCMSYWMVPITTMCATFASVAYASTKLRQKDDYCNYALACT
jgi:ABC-type branched-subunit amino acid transport system permease subunit